MIVTDFVIVGNPCIMVGLSYKEIDNIIDDVSGGCHFISKELLKVDFDIGICNQDTLADHNKTSAEPVIPEEITNDPSQKIFSFPGIHEGSDALVVCTTTDSLKALKDNPFASTWCLRTKDRMNIMFICGETDQSIAHWMKRAGWVQSIPTQ